MRPLTLALCAGLSLSIATVALADSPAAPLSVSAGAAARIVLSGPVRDIVVGDPSVADVSLVNERTLVVLGKKAGATTILAFDARGRALADRDVVVSDVPTQAVVVQRGLSAATYACGDRCSLLGATNAPAAPAPAAAVP
ncbi:pilus assembly protein CpaC [Caulobacter sp. Root487D2Y]|uniref:pilus assembly protein N-terminal domain-containing protein n=1 Tax=Caulobacter sp. Root487D2Y TaxID=1736547 RepID=UPI0006FC6CD3|nr:pilus assembly protein N-terminal domain-containing protein [Caulobacter sp. Root487D2Y]KQY35564.1 pilus assembly protein CpaC [Caulobacter sp. Root487D2Y]